MVLPNQKVRYYRHFSESIGCYLAHKLVIAIIMSLGNTALTSKKHDNHLVFRYLPPYSSEAHARISKKSETHRVPVVKEA
jgi:hypothetical protein